MRDSSHSSERSPDALPDPAQPVDVIPALKTHEVEVLLKPDRA